MAWAAFNLRVRIEDENPGAARISDLSSKLEWEIQDAIGDVLDRYDDEIGQWAIKCQREIG